MECLGALPRWLGRNGLGGMRLPLLVIGSLMVVAPAMAGDFTLVSGQDFVRSKGKPEAQQFIFSAPLAGGDYTLRVYNGQSGSSPVTSGAIVLNGTTLFGPGQFGQNVTFLEQSVQLGLSNELAVTLNGKPGSGLRIEVVGHDETAPSISASTAPTPNAAGWHREDVTVSFQCSDAFSGIAECSSPQQVSEEGSGIIVEGQAIDQAQNSASTQVVVNLDKTSPQVAATLVPVANEAGWHNSALTVSYACSDALSGIERCPEPISWTQEGAQQTLTAQALDLAGNSQSLSTVVSLDFTAPTLAAVFSDTANAAGWHREPVTVTFSCEDSLSGVADCPSARTLDEDGSRQVFSVAASDLAGNQATQSVTINLDQTPPSITFVYPANGALLGQPKTAVQVRLSDNLSLATNSFELQADGIVLDCNIANGLANCSMTGISAVSPTELIAVVSDTAGNISTAQIAIALDSDGDQLADHLDQCGNTPIGEPADANGCGASQRDTDGDGFSDAEEIAAGTDLENALDQPSLKILSFTALPSLVQQKDVPVQLVWQVQGAQQVKLLSDAGGASVDDLPGNGFISLAPTITTNYTLVAARGNDLESQSISVRVELPPEPNLWQNPAASPVPADKIASSLSVAADGSSYLGSFDGNFYKLDANGKPVWTLNDAGLIKGKALFVGELIIVGANVGGLDHDGGAGRIYALDTEKNIHWQVDVGSAVIASPALSDAGDTVFVASYSGEVLAVDTISGRVLWRYQLPANQGVVATPAYISTQAALVVHSADGKLFAIDVNAGSDVSRLLWEKTLTP